MYWRREPYSSLSTSMWSCWDCNIVESFFGLMYWKDRRMRAQNNATVIKASLKPLCIVNVYMPSSGSAEADTEYSETLDQLHENLIKYCGSHDIVVSGDLNAFLHRPKCCPRDSLLRSFLAEHNLSLPKYCPIGDTFFHASDDPSSQIDYFIVQFIPQ